MANSQSLDGIPCDNASVLSRFFLHWISPLLQKCRQQGTLNLSDLYDVPSDLQSTTLTDKLEANWFDEVKQNSKHPSLIRATFRTMGWKPFLLGLLEIAYGFFRILQSLLLILLMNFFQPCSKMPIWQAWCLLLLICLAVFVSSTLSNQYTYRMEIYSGQMRIAYTGLIFRKVLRLSSYSMNSLSTGEISNLIMKDTKQIDNTIYRLNYLWIVPIEIIAVSYLLWYWIRYVAFIAIGYAMIVFLIQPFYGHILSRIRGRVLRLTDERIKVLSQIVQSMRMVKMYCWEIPLVKRICLVRRNEIIENTFGTFYECLHLVIVFNYISVTFLIIYGSIWMFDLTFDTRLFAIVACMLGFMRIYVIEFFSSAIRDLSYFVPSRQRIETFLLLNESQRDHRLLSSSQTETESNHAENLQQHKPDIFQFEIICHLESAHWNDEENFSLKKITFDAHPGDLICIIGPVGSGKSSLLQALTGEIAYFNGKVRLRGSFCYVPQEAWIFSSTIKENILFGQVYDEKLFRQVIRVTALDTDLEQLPKNIQTVVGDQGVTLSGGQKARVNMARALYRNADIYLLDDPLSSVDVKVVRHLFQRAIREYLGNKICILVTHQIQYLQEATKIIVLDRGEMINIGTYRELMTRSATFAQLLRDIHHQDDTHLASSPSHRRQTVISNNQSCTEQGDELSTLITSNDHKIEGTVNWRVYLSYIRAGLGSSYASILIAFVFIIYQLLWMFSNWWLAMWSDDETYRYNTFENCTSKLYFKAHEVQTMTIDQWKTHRNRRFFIYLILVGLLLLSTFLRTFSSKIMCLNAARILHNRMLKRIIWCPTRFFDNNPVGCIINRFSNDISIMDDYLTVDLPDLLDCIFEVLGAVFMVGILNPWAFLPTIIGIGGIFLVRLRFVSSSRDLKRLEGSLRSPVHTHLNSTIHGLKIIRSYHAEEMVSESFLRHVNNHTRAHFLMISVNRWAAIRFDWISLLFLFLVTASSLMVRIVQRTLSTADLVLILSYSLNLVGLFQWTIRQNVEVEMEMTAVERILDYCSLETESSASVTSVQSPPLGWPYEGQISFEHVSMSYDKLDESALALHDISLTIKSSEKIGIVGRTGAGKTSFIQLLFRMGYLIEGNITIDHINIANLSLEDLRNRISIIPQDPVLFSGTIRDNLDPSNNYSDEMIWDVLEQVQLKALIKGRMSHELNSPVTEYGSNLSAGQKQLICLARALLKKSKILVVDEGTANLDHHTDEFIQQIIRSLFKQCTVLTVAHRLRTIIDSDRIMVLDHGTLVEFDAPATLVADSTSHFYSLVQQTGPVEAEYLKWIVQTKHVTV